MEQVAYLQKWFRIVPKRFWRQQDRVVKIGIVFTVCFFAFVLLFGFAPSCEGSADCKDAPSKWSVFWSAPPNVVGDTLAGVAGVLAFLWIIVTVLLQGKELAAQRQELKQARKEYKKMADAQTDQLRVLEKQKEIFEDEQRQRKEARADQLFNEKLRTFVVSLTEASWKGLCWTFSTDIIEEYGGNGRVWDRNLSKKDYETQSADETILDLRLRLPGFREVLWEENCNSVDSRLPEQGEVFFALVRELESILALKDRLSAPQQERLARLQIAEVLEQLRQLSTTSELWEGSANETPH